MLSFVLIALLPLVKPRLTLGGEPLELSALERESLGGESLGSESRGGESVAANPPAPNRASRRR